MIVLYVDDSATMQRIAEITLRDTGLEYVGARTAEDGFQLALEHQPGIVLVDALLGSASGYELCARIKATPELAGVLVLIVCGNSAAYDPARGAQARADGTVTKPWDTTVLVDKLQALLDGDLSGVAAPPPAASAPSPARPPFTPPAYAPPAGAAPAGARAQTRMAMPAVLLPAAPMPMPMKAKAQMFEAGESEEPIAVVVERPRYVDDNVQFTIYRPKVIPPAKWHPLLAFAHLAERRDDEDDDLDPIEEVQRQAQQALGADAERFTDTTQDASASIPAEGELTIVPEIAGFDVNPRTRTFLWTEAVHREEFRIRAGAALDGQTARGKVTVWLGSLIVAEVPLAIRVASGASTTDARPAPAKARPYRKIFASYSHRDAHIVDEVSRLGRALGDEYIRDWIHLRSGQVWNDQLRTLIAEADIFQLFWSTNSMRSRYCREEWEYALSLGRTMFVRPTYWEDPMPTDPAAALPPEELVRLHFQKIRAGGEWTAPPPVAEPTPTKAPMKTQAFQLDAYEERRKRVGTPTDDLPVMSSAAPPVASFRPTNTAPETPRESRRGLVVLAIGLLVIAAVVAYLLLR